MQRLSFFANKKIIPSEDFIEMWGPLFIEMWLILEPWILQKRINNGESLSFREGAYSRKDFESFAAECASYQSIGLMGATTNLRRKYPSGMDRLQKKARR